MAKSRRKHYSVTTTNIISANNKSDALAKASRKKVDAEVLMSEVTGEQIPAAVAHERSAQA